MFEKLQHMIKKNMDLDKISNLIGSLNKEHFINRLPDRLDCFKHGLS